MVWPFLALVAIFLVETHADQPFKVFEIRKPRNHDHRIDDQYYDPDLSRIQSAIHRETDDNKLMKLASDIDRRLQILSQAKKRGDFSSSDSDSSFVDETRSVIVIPSEDAVYHTGPAKENVFQKLIQSALRNGFEDVEDRTAPPIHRIPYDYEE